MKAGNQMDLTQGNPIKQIVLFSLPLILGNIAQQLYSTVDAIIVGRYLGDHALGAVGASGPILNFLLVVFVAFSTGTGVLVGQYYGAKNRDSLNRSIGNAYVWMFLMSLLLMVLGSFTVDPLLHALQTPDEMMDMASVYLKTKFIGIFGFAFYNIFTGVLRALGDSLFPLIALIVSTIMNIALDILFVRDFQMGVFGAALATIISQFGSAMLCAIRLHRMRDVFDNSFQYMRVDRAVSGQMFRLGAPNAVTQSFYSLAFLFLQVLYNTFGPAVVTAFSVALRVDNFIMLPIMTFSVAATTFTAQNVGALKMDRVKAGANATIKVGITSSMLMMGMIMLFGEEFARIFTNTDEILEHAGVFLRIYSVGFVMVTFTQVLGGVMRGAGDSTTPMWIAMFCLLALRIPMAYLLVELSKSAVNPQGLPVMIVYGHILSHFISGILSIVYYKKGHWRKHINALNTEAKHA